MRELVGGWKSYHSLAFLSWMPERRRSTPQGAGHEFQLLTSLCCSCHVHWLLDTSPEYKEKYGWEMKHKNFESDMAFLKHIRPMTWTGEDGKLKTEECYFGRESDEPGYHLFIQD